MKATKQQTPKCWMKLIHPELLGDTYVPQRLGKISVPKVQTPMFSVSLEMKKRSGSAVAFEMSSGIFVKGMVID